LFLKDFLVEPKLLALLEPLESNEKSLIKLDAIFRALKVENEDDIKMMAKYFVDHIQQSKVYVSSGAGPEQEEEKEEMTEVRFDEKNNKSLLGFHFRLVINK
jgi:dynein regulatory complex protein 1